MKKKPKFHFDENKVNALIVDTHIDEESRPAREAS